LGAAADLDLTSLSMSSGSAEDVAKVHPLVNVGKAVPSLYHLSSPVRLQPDDAQCSEIPRVGRVARCPRVTTFDVIEDVVIR
jgi:hypothetical protein